MEKNLQSMTIFLLMKELVIKTTLVYVTMEISKILKGWMNTTKVKASSISGLEKLDDYTVKIHYKEMTPSMSS